jgi:hypothetical protein
VTSDPQKVVCELDCKMGLGAEWECRSSDLSRTLHRSVVVARQLCGWLMGVLGTFLSL